MMKNHSVSLFPSVVSSAACEPGEGHFQNLYFVLFSKFRSVAINKLR